MNSNPVRSIIRLDLLGVFVSFPPVCQQRRKSCIDVTVRFSVFGMVITDYFFYRQE